MLFVVIIVGSTRRSLLFLRRSTTLLPPLWACLKQQRRTKIEKDCCSALGSNRRINQMLMRCVPCCVLVRSMNNVTPQRESPPLMLRNYGQKALAGECELWRALGGKEIVESSAHTNSRVGFYRVSIRALALRSHQRVPECISSDATTTVHHIARYHITIHFTASPRRSIE